MSETSLKPVIDKLENLFSKFNEKFYNGELQTPIITVSPDTTKGAYGWCTAWKAWSNKQPEQKKKDKICKLLCKVLQLTRGASDLKSLDFNPDSEIVTAVFEGGSRTINVACDSGTAMIRDIMNHLEC